jgi:sec-independent protein translocase protein TatC
MSSPQPLQQRATVLPVAEPAFKEAPLTAHLDELRSRIIYSVLGWIVATGAASFYVAQLVQFLQGPVQGYIAKGGKVTWIAQNITDKFMVFVQVAMFAGLVLAMPVVVYQIWAFIAPGLTRNERRWAAPFIIGMIGAFVAGVAFAYFVTLPIGIPFMLDFAGLDSVVQIGNFFPIGAYIGQVVAALAVFGVLFELPILMFLLTKIGLVNAAFLTSIRRYAIFGIAVLSAVVTPTGDPINLALMAVPLALLYEVGILLSRFAGRSNNALINADEFDEINA